MKNVCHSKKFYCRGIIFKKIYKKPPSICFISKGVTMRAIYSNPAG